MLQLPEIPIPSRDLRTSDRLGKRGAWWHVALPCGLRTGRPRLRAQALAPATHLGLCQFSADARRAGDPGRGGGPPVCVGLGRRWGPAPLDAAQGPVEGEPAAGVRVWVRVWLWVWVWVWVWVWLWVCVWVWGIGSVAEDWGVQPTAGRGPVPLRCSCTPAHVPCSGGLRLVWPPVPVRSTPEILSSPFCFGTPSPLNHNRLRLDPVRRRLDPASPLPWWTGDRVRFC